MTRDDTENINLDLKNWNMCQRFESNNKIEKELDSLHGTSFIYQDSHLWMQRCFVMLNNRLTPPKISESGLPCVGIFCHVNQFGGYEGMRQKMWTISTICLIIATAKKLNIQIIIIGQGDNQVILIKWTKDQCEYKDRLRVEILESLSASFTSIGLTLKTEGTWISKYLMEYGKRRYYKGKPISNALKSAKRCLSDENVGLSTLEGCITSITTCTENIANNDNSPDAAFLLHNWAVLELLDRKKIVNLKTPDEVLVSLLFWHLDFGGLPISAYANHIIRGINDKITIFISMFLYIKDNYKLYYQILQILIPLKFKSNQNLESLMTDIYGINIEKLSMGSLVLKDVAKNSLKHFATNTEITQLLNFNSVEIQCLVKEFSRLTPLYLPLLHEIIRSSDSGLILGLQNRLTSVQSVMKMADSYLYPDLFKHIRRTDI